MSGLVAEGSPALHENPATRSDSLLRFPVAAGPPWTLRLVSGYFPKVLASSRRSEPDAEVVSSNYDSSGRSLENWIRGLEGR